MEINISKHVTKVVQGMYNKQPDEIPEYLVAFGTHELNPGEEVRYVLLLDALVSEPVVQIRNFGAMLKSTGVHVNAVVLVISGMMLDAEHHLVSIVLGMSRSGDYEQMIFDFGYNKAYPSMEIREEDKELCAALFLGQVLYKTELKDARWN